MNYYYFVVFSVLFTYVLSAPLIQKPANKELPRIAKIGGYHIGGKTVALIDQPWENVTLQAGQPPRPYNPNGEFTTGQMYVHYTILSQPVSLYPILFIHGGFMTGVCWEDTPDGRDGRFFLKAGFSVYVADAVERGRSGWSKFPQIYSSPPIYASKQYAWNNFRIGVPDTYTDTNRVPFENSQFDIDSFDQFHKLAVPRWTVTDDLITEAYLELVDKICTPKCILIGHSQGGTFSYNITIQRPEKIAAVITVEPGSAPPLDRFDPSVVKDVKHMTIWGDNVLTSTPQWQSNWNICLNYVSTLKAAGVPFDLIQLVPEYGIRGNTHFLMTDKNSDDVAGIVYTWLVNNSYITIPSAENSGVIIRASLPLLLITTICNFSSISKFYREAVNTSDILWRKLIDRDFKHADREDESTKYITKRAKLAVSSKMGEYKELFNPTYNGMGIKVYLKKLNLPKKDITPSFSKTNLGPISQCHAKYIFTIILHNRGNQKYRYEKRIIQSRFEDGSLFTFKPKHTIFALMQQSGLPLYYYLEKNEHVKIEVPFWLVTVGGHKYLSMDKGQYLVPADGEVTCVFEFTNYGSDYCWNGRYRSNVITWDI